MSERPDFIDGLVAAARRLAREELIPAEPMVEAQDDVPERIIAKLRELGLFGMTIPRSYGGLELSMHDEARVVFEIGYASPVFRSRFGSSNGVATLSILNDGTENQRQRYLPLIARGELIAGFCLSEADAGSDAAALATRAEHTGDHYVISGTKRLVTNAPGAELFVVYARTAPDEVGARGISAFLVDRDAPGIRVTEPYKMMGFRGAHTADVIFEDCRIPSSALLGTREGVGFRTAMKSLDHGRLHMAALAAGLCERLIDEGVRYAMQRRQFGQPIAQFQLIQGMLADCRAEALAARAMVGKVARDKDAGVRITGDAACCKYFATEALGRIADRVLQIHGGYGYIKGHAIERLYRDVRLLRLYEGTSQILQLVIAREMLREETS